MKITKTQLRQLIKEVVLAESEWVPVDVIEPQSHGFGTEAEQTPNHEVALENTIMALIADGSTPDEIQAMVTDALYSLSEAKENNPWAICTSSVGREDKEKYEKCVKSVKAQNKEDA